MGGEDVRGGLGRQNAMNAMPFANRLETDLILKICSKQTSQTRRSLAVVPEKKKKCCNHFFENFFYASKVLAPHSKPGPQTPAAAFLLRCNKLAHW